MNKLNHIYVFGAHSRARTAARYLTDGEGKNNLLAYLIDNDEDHEDEIGGVPVIDIRNECELDTTASVYIGTRGVYFKRVAEHLSALGFSEIYPVDVRLDTELRTEYFKKRFKAEGRPLVLLNELKPGVHGFDSGHVGVAGLDRRATGGLDSGASISKGASGDLDSGASISKGASGDLDSRASISKGVSGDLNSSALISKAVSGDAANVCIFEVRSVYDKPLMKDMYVRAPYEKSIQVGAALTDIVLTDCEYRDNDGENISGTNRQLCEITALYWMWKHSAFDIVGLVHYRRHFLMPAGWIERMMENDVDIILPLPLYIEPSVEENYRFRHVSSDWDHMLRFMEENHRDQMDAVRRCFSDTYYYPCNMFVMKRDVFYEYCSWLFPILFYVMDHVGSREDVYQNRYPAFMAERMLTLFCYINRDRYKIVSADKNFLE